MTTVRLTLKDKNTGEVSEREVGFMREFWRKNSTGEVEDWIKERGNAQHSTPKHKADLELVSRLVLQP